MWTVIQEALSQQIRGKHYQENVWQLGVNEEIFLNQGEFTWLRFSLN